MEQHSKGIKTFFEKHGVIDALNLAEQYHHRWTYQDYWRNREQDLLY